MKALNLYAFTRVDTDYAAEYMNMLSARERREKCRPHEFLTIKKLVETLLKNDVSVELLDGFFFSYTIGQIGKEFDLLKIEQDRAVLNIELKSEAVPLEEIEKQLRTNRYYLGFVAADIRLFTFVASTETFYQLIGDTCFQVPCEALMDALPGFKGYITADIEKLFEPAQFLISPFTDPTKFLKGKYFLTQQQQEIREKILAAVEEKTNPPHLFGITGGTGSGKTLLLYDIARTLARDGHSCRVIHTGELSPGHRYLNDRWEHVEILSVKDLWKAGEIKNEKEYVFIDEAHRLYPQDAEKLVQDSEAQQNVLIFSYDNEQWLSHTERIRDIPAFLESLPGFTEWVLSRRIRTGIEIAAFYRNMLDLNSAPRGEMDYSHIDVLYAENEGEAELLTDFYTGTLHYHCPNRQHPTSGVSGSVNKPEGGFDSITGQEYDNVLIRISDHFCYMEDGTLRNSKIQEKIPEYDAESVRESTSGVCTESDPKHASGSDSESLDSFMYQNITRTRGSLCILVIGNYVLFQQIAGIKYRMLERVQYKESIFAASLSGKQLTKLSKAVKTSAENLPVEDGALASDTTDIIQEQLIRPDSGRKILQTCFRVLSHLCRDHAEDPAFTAAAEEYMHYIRSGN